MGKSVLTKQLEKDIYESIHKRGVFCCLEVTIGWYGKERVDMLSYDTKGVFRCFEIKSSISDFHSKAIKSFLGHYNYYVMTQELYGKVKDEIPDWVGVYIHGVCEKRAKKQTVSDLMFNTLKDSMIRSLYRYFEDDINSKNESLIKYKNREIARLRSEKDNLYKRYRDISNELYELKRHKK